MSLQHLTNNIYTQLFTDFASLCTAAAHPSPETSSPAAAAPCSTQRLAIVLLLMKTMLQPSRPTQRCVSETRLLLQIGSSAFCLVLAAPGPGRAWPWWMCQSYTCSQGARTCRGFHGLHSTCYCSLLAHTRMPGRPWSLEPSWGTTLPLVSTRHGHTPTSSCSSGWRRCRTRAGP